MLYIMSIQLIVLSLLTAGVLLILERKKYRGIVFWCLSRTRYHAVFNGRRTEIPSKNTGRNISWQNEPERSLSSAREYSQQRGRQRGWWRRRIRIILRTRMKTLLWLIRTCTYLFPFSKPPFATLSTFMSRLNHSRISSSPPVSVRMDSVTSTGTHAAQKYWVWCCSPQCPAGWPAGSKSCQWLTDIFIKHKTPLYSAAPSPNCDATNLREDPRVLKKKNNNVRAWRENNMTINHIHTEQKRHQHKITH